MPPKQRHQRLLFSQLVSAEVSAEEARSELVLASVAKSTTAQYQAQMRQLARYLAALRDLVLLPDPASVTKQEFFKFLLEKKRQGQATASVARAALLQLQRAQGLVQFAGDADIIKATEAVEKSAAACRVDKGTLTQNMLEELLEWLLHSQESQDASAVHLAVFVGFAAELRVSELKLLRVGDLQPMAEDAKHCLIFLRQNKAGKTNTTTKPAPISVLELVREWCRKNGLEHGNFLFPRAIKPLLTSALERASLALNWPKGFLWHPTHVLRISGAAGIKGEVEEVLQHFFSGQSAAVFRHYARPLENRKRGRE